ncbi:hypothetical protein J4N42_04470 [Vibrio sp. SCSIO 43135]|uniref:hypothetical protein n=1 Tax=Vibrio sp. SCSIO 43135 TaxID=2819096 RepID=UPI0020755053|nr:hypothetical protein [Vibrio sp. SCSIO 43135]USD41982.1 hypothetical protein J4N42_04470 [Vibrio sp. SCSIO 43135]
MKKFVYCCAALASFSAYASESSETDLAVGMAVDQQLSVVIEINDQYRAIIGNEGAAFDYIFANGSFDDSNNPLTWYVGAGAWGEWDHDFGMRVPLGLNVDLSKGWDLYGQIHPELNLYKGPELQIGAALGIKYSF